MSGCVCVCAVCSYQAPPWDESSSIKYTQEVKIGWGENEKRKTSFLTTLSRAAALRQLKGFYQFFRCRIMECGRLFQG